MTWTASWGGCWAAGLGAMVIGALILLLRCGVVSAFASSTALTYSVIAVLMGLLLVWAALALPEW